MTKSSSAVVTSAGIGGSVAGGDTLDGSGVVVSYRANSFPSLDSTMITRGPSSSAMDAWNGLSGAMSVCQFAISVFCLVTVIFALVWTRVVTTPIFAPLMPIAASTFADWAMPMAW